MFERTEAAKQLLANCTNKENEESHRDEFLNLIEKLIADEGVKNFNNLKDGRGYTLLHIAVETAKESHVSILLDKNVQVNDTDAAQTDYVNARNSQYETPLHIASERGLVEIARILIKTGRAKVNGRDSDDWTSLHRASYYNNKEMVELLLGCEGIDVNKVAESSEQWTPLHAAAKMGNKDIVLMLLRAGAHLSMEVVELRRGDRPLTMAAFNGCYDMCKILLEHGADHRAVDKSGWSSLHKAAFNRHRNIVKLLTEKDSSAEHINYAAKQDGYTPLLCAVASNDDLVVELLLEHSVTTSIDLEAKGKRRGDTVLLMAAFNCAESIVKMLLDKGSDPTAVDTDGWSVLHKCCYGGKNVEFVQFFIDIFINKNLDVNVCAPRDLWSPLHCAAASGNQEIVQKLLDNGAKPSLEVKDRHRHDTPLLLAAFRGNVEVIRTLLSNGASLEAQDKDGWTALMKVSTSFPSIHFLLLITNVDDYGGLHALFFNFCHIKACYSKKCFVDAVDLLLKEGAIVIHMAAADGYTALHACAQNDNSLEVMKLLLNKGAVIDAKETLRGNTPLLYAAYNGFIDSVNFLIEKGADINSTDNEGWGAIHKVMKSLFYTCLFVYSSLTLSSPSSPSAFL